MNARGLAAGLALVLIAGCVSVPRAARDARNFDLLGRILVASSSSAAFTANLRWQHAQQVEISLMTPMGQIVAQIVDTGSGATLTQADQKTYSAGSVEDLTQRALGWPLPLSLLQYWIRGEAAPGFAASDVQRDAGGRATALTQNGWRVAIAYSAEGDTAGRARRLDMKGSGNEIRFVIDTWHETGAAEPRAR
jgi:outer membrane lipoprotein LolB